MNDAELKADQVPARVGYRMPAEWHPHESTWLAWPKDPQTFPDRLPEVEEIFLRLISLLAREERVDLLVDDADMEERIRRLLKPHACPPGSVTFHHIATADCWIRDYGPNFLLRPRRETAELAFNHWDFNAWGGKYEALIADGRIPALLEPLLGVPRFEPGMILEGGSIDVNGAGTCLTTEQCLLNANRNPGLTRDEIEEKLRDYLGVEQIIWLGEGIAGDDTDGHVDDIARFVSPNTVVCALEEDPADENYARLRDNLQRLKSARDTRDRPFRVVTVPMPRPVQGREAPLPATYVNFYIANGLVLVPTFGQDRDRRVLEVLQALFPQRRVCGIRCEAMVWGLGALHCATQQQPGRRTNDQLRYWLLSPSGTR